MRLPSCTHENQLTKRFSAICKHDAERLHSPRNPFPLVAIRWENNETWKYLWKRGRSVNIPGFNWLERRTWCGTWGYLITKKKNSKFNHADLVITFLLLEVYSRQLWLGMQELREKHLDRQWPVVTWWRGEAPARSDMHAVWVLGKGMTTLSCLFACESKPWFLRDVP
jgi:hypothetical protein